MGKHQRISLVVHTEVMIDCDVLILLLLLLLFSLDSSGTSAEMFLLV